MEPEPHVPTAQTAQAGALQPTPLVSAVILNWNGGTEVLACVRSVIDQTYQRIELIIVDNGSTDGSFAALQHTLAGSTRFERLEFIAHPNNLGFAGGMNSGIACCAGDVLLLLNMDLQLDPHFVQVGLSTFARDDGIGLVGARCYRLDLLRRTQQVSGTGLMLRWRVQLARLPDDAPGQYVFGPHGSCPMIRHELLEQVRMPNGDYYGREFFAYGEDTDLWLRAQLLGWRCYYEPAAVAWHRQGAGTGGKVRTADKPPEFQFHVLKNRYLIILRGLPTPLLLGLLPVLAAVEALAILYFVFVSPRLLLQLPRAWLYVAKSLPSVIQQRRHIQSGRTVPISSITRFFVGI